MYYQHPPTTGAEAFNMLDGNVNKLPPPSTAAEAFTKLDGVKLKKPLKLTTAAQVALISKLSGESNAKWDIDPKVYAERELKRVGQQLTVNVDAEESNGMHSWRPNLTDSLTSDVFVAQSSLDNAFHSKREQPPQLFLWDSPIREESLLSKTDAEPKVSHPDDSGNYPRIDVQNYLQNQKTQLNCLKYEIINAKSKLHEVQAVVAKLSRELEENLLLKKIQSKEKKVVHDENEELRLECQCLCSEVDYYLKGKARLGEVDDPFWDKFKEENKSNSKWFPTNLRLFRPPLSRKFNSEEQEEEANKWNCPRCTFANHPAISSCEMCHVDRFVKQTAQSHSSDNCFCHPKQGPHCS